MPCLMVLIAAVTAGQTAAYHPGRHILPLVPHSLRKHLLKQRIFPSSTYTPPAPLATTPPLSCTATSCNDATTRDQHVVISPAAFGGDPTGNVDSTAAVQAAVAFCVNRSQSTPQTFSFMARDAAGCAVDLEGGEYLISEPLIIPTYVSNMRVQSGSLVANPKSTAWKKNNSNSNSNSNSNHIVGVCSASTFPTPRSNEWCQALTVNPEPQSHSSAAACFQACCDLKDTCNTWQWCAPTQPCATTLPAPHTKGCYISKSLAYNPQQQCKAARTGLPTSEGWEGASVAAGPPPPPPPPPPPSPAPPTSTANFMIQVGGTVKCVAPGQGSCNENIGFPGLFIDGSHVAAGIVVNDVMGTTIGPQTYMLNFTNYGIQVNGGHEVMILETWLGETNFDYDFSAPGNAGPEAVAIAINSNDHYILNSIVFSSKIGLYNKGAANMATGLHVWFPQNAAQQQKALAFVDTGHQNRYEACYIDGSTALFVAPSETTWTGAAIHADKFATPTVMPLSLITRKGFVLGGQGFWIRGNVTNFKLTNTEFVGGGVKQDVETCPGPPPNPSLPHSPSCPVRLINTDISGNLEGVASYRVQGTKATQRQSSATPKGSWTFDFCAMLAFASNIPTVTSITFTTPGSSLAFPSTVARAPTNCSDVTIDVMPASSGSLVVSVDNSDYSVGWD